MTDTTIELYEALVAAGVDEARAKAAAKSVAARADLDKLVSQDRLDAVQATIIAELRRTHASTLQWVATMLVGQAAAILALQSLFQ